MGKYTIHLFERLLPIFLHNIKLIGVIFIKLYSDITKQEYEGEEVVNILNTKQAGMYIKHNARLMDLYWSRDSLVFVFSRNETKELYDLWCKRELI